MGGFKLFDENGPVRTLEPQELQTLARKGDIDFPDITEREIQDRSKGDALSKGLVVIQTSWFILQCIARRIERLPITELELVTLAFAALNFITYTLWWNKPLDVQCPFRVLQKRRKDESEESKGVLVENSGQNPDDEESGEDNEGRGTDAMAVLHVLMGSAMCGALAIVRKIPEAIGKATGAIVHTIRDACERSVKYVSRHRWWTLWNGVKGAVEHGILEPMAAIASMGLGDNDVGEMFYAGDSGGVSRWSIGMAGAVIATIFGSIHCVAWSFQFPSHPEQLLWRIASLSITCSPMVMVFAGLLGDQLDRLPDWLQIVLLLVSPDLYVLSRVALLVIAFMSLRSLPTGAYETVHWTTFIPHV